MAKIERIIIDLDISVNIRGYGLGIFTDYESSDLINLFRIKNAIFFKFWFFIVMIIWPLNKGSKWVLS